MPEEKPTWDDPLLKDTVRRVREKMDIAREFLRASEEYLRRIEDLSESPSADWRVDDGVVNGLLKGLDIQDVAPPWKAIVALLTYVGRPLPRKVIVRAMILGRAKLGQYKDKSVNQAISTNIALSKPKLKESRPRKRVPDPESLVGLYEWSDECFKPPST